MPRKGLYLLLTVLGAVLPMTQFVPWLRVHGLDGPLFVQDLFANRISSFFAIDLLLSAVAVMAWARAQRRQLRLWWLPVLVTVCVGVSAGLPLLLYLREREAAEVSPS